LALADVGDLTNVRCAHGADIRRRFLEHDPEKHAPGLDPDIMLERQDGAR
jgi:hypothetical protein